MPLPDRIQKHRQITPLISISLFLTIIDIYTTYALHGRGHVELNPLMRPILTNLGPTAFLLINFTLSFLLIAFLAHASIKYFGISQKFQISMELQCNSSRKLEGRYQYLPLLVYCVIRGSVVVNNLLILASVL